MWQDMPSISHYYSLHNVYEIVGKNDVYLAYTCTLCHSPCTLCRGRSSLLYSSKVSESNVYIFCAQVLSPRGIALLKIM